MTHEQVNASVLIRYEDCSAFDTLWEHQDSKGLWSNGGIYEDKYMMDRPIGACESADEAATKTVSYTSALYYQFGRKDPFHSTANSNKSSSRATMIESIQNPTKFYNVGFTTDWVSGSDYSVATYGWNDKNSSSSPSNENYGNKSIFDPSPYGWRLPVYEAWSSFFPTTYSKTNIYTQAGALPGTLTAGTYSTYYTCSGGDVINFPKYGRLDGGTANLTTGDIGYSCITPQQLASGTVRQYFLSKAYNSAGRATATTAICVEDE